MNPVKNNIILFVLIAILFISGCATIVGGSKYNAHIVVKDNPNALIFYKGEKIGSGSVIYKVKRKDANKLIFIVREEGCEEQEFSFKFKKLRGWALFGSIAGWTGSLGPVPFPFGTIVDISTGALWKPNIAEKGVTKENYKNFKYTLDYSGCKNDSKIDNIEKLKVYLVYLKNGSVIKGEIIEMVPSQYMRVKTFSDNILNIAIDDIERVIQE